jgi:hypothetical protein
MIKKNRERTRALFTLFVLPLFNSKISIIRGNVIAEGMQRIEREKMKTFELEEGGEHFGL